MKRLLLLVLILSSPMQAHAYTIGNAPFCMVDNVGNAKCFYYTYDACIQALQANPLARGCTTH